MNLKAIHIFIIFIIITFLDILFSTYFQPLFLVGIVFMIFINCLKNGYYYLLLLSILMFVIIEVILGIKIFTFTFISIFLYLFIIPKIKHLFSSLLFRDFTYLLIFYIIIFIDFILTSHYNIESYKIFLVNFIVDSIIVGVLL